MPAGRPARLLAPLALAVFAVAFIVVVASSGGGGGSKSTPTGERRTVSRAAPARPRQPPRHYTVKASDTSLAAIAAKTGVPVSRLIALNPSLDPQSLAPGQRIRLRP